MSEAIVECRELNKSYHDGNTSVNVLQGIHFTVCAGDRIAIVGPSGSGKSTFLHLLGGLDKPTSGEVLMNGLNWQTLSERQRCRLRNQQLGFVYQFHHLLPEFTALENVAITLLIAGVSIKEAEDRAQKMLTDVGLEQRMQHKPSQLSGGERQRVAIARALVHQPHCIFADEPTGNLDHTTAMKVFDLMLELNQKSQTSLVIVSHDRQLAERMDKVFILQEGQLIIV
jgi:lipoprotein-releasing system ATP-binding protein